MSWEKTAHDLGDVVKLCIRANFKMVKKLTKLEDENARLKAKLKKAAK